MKTERRREPRVSINQEFESIDEFIAEYATNISRSGCFIRSKYPLPVGTRVNLRFTLISTDIEIVEGMGEVVHVEERSGKETGMGVRFVELSPSSRHQVEELLRVAVT